VGRAFGEAGERHFASEQKEAKEEEGNGVVGRGSPKEHHKAVQKHGRPEKWDGFGLPEALKPQCHIFYERRVNDVVDGLPKWRYHIDTELMGDRDR
jgi:hypothetical protein